MPSWSPFQPPKPRVSKLKAKPAKPVGTTAAKTPVVNDLPPHPAADTPAPKTPAYVGGKVKPAVKKTRVTGNPVEALLAQLVKGSEVNARRAVQAQLAPFMAQFAAAQHQQTTSESQRRAALEGFTRSLMGVLQGNVPGVEQGYANAEAQIGALSSAASQSFAAQNPNAQDQALLQAVNAPAGQQAALARQNQSLFGQGANTLGYLGGTLPREYLTQAGLAQGTYARSLPGIAALSGEQAFRQQLQAFSTERQKLQAQRASVLAQIPGLMQKVQASNQAQRATAINSLLGYKVKQKELAQQLAYRNAQVAHQQRLDEYQMGYLQLQNAKSSEQAAQAWTRINGYISNETGAPVTGANGQPVMTAAAAQAQATEARLEASGAETARHNAATESNSQAAIQQRRDAAAARAKAKTASVRQKAVKGRGAAWVALDKAIISAGKAGLPRDKIVTNTLTGKPSTVRTARKNGDAILTQIMQGYGTSLTSQYGVPKARVTAHIRQKLRALGYKV